MCLLNENRLEFLHFLILWNAKIHSHELTFYEESKTETTSSLYFYIKKVKLANIFVNHRDWILL